MTEENFWGEVGDLTGVRTPLTVLREQAAVVSKITDGSVYGEVSTGSRDNELFAELELVVPALNEYRLAVVSIFQPVTLFPLRVYDEIMNQSHNCADHEQFDALLKDILGSTQMKTILRSLVVQAKE